MQRVRQPSRHQIPEACWALDHKGIAYTKKNLLPALHILTTRTLAPNSALPVLADGDESIQQAKQSL